MGADDFRELVESRWERLLGVAWLSTGSEAAAHQVLLASFVETEREWSEQGQAPASDLTRDLVDRCRKAVSDDVPLTPDLDASDDDPSLGELDRARRDILLAATQLYFDQRVALGLRHLEDLTDGEIAHALDSSTEHVASALGSAHGALATHLPHERGAAVEALLRPALWDRAETLNTGDAWEQVQGAIRDASARRRKVTALVLAGVLALVIGAGTVYAAGYVNADPQPRAAIGQQTTSGAEHAGDDLRTWPLRGSLAHGHADELDQLRRGSKEPGLKTERFVFAGDVGASRFVLATAEQADGEPDGLTRVISWKGPRGTPFLRLSRIVEETRGAGFVSVRSSLGNPGDVLILTSSDPHQVQVSREPTYQRTTGQIMRDWEVLQMTDGVGVTRTGPMGEAGVAVVVDRVSVAWPFTYGAGFRSDQSEGMVEEFARTHNLARSDVLVLETHTLEFSAESAMSPRRTGRAVEQRAVMVTVQRPDGVVFRMGSLTEGSDPERDFSTMPLAMFVPTPSASWRNRPQMVIQPRPQGSSQSGLKPPGRGRDLLTVMAPGAERITVQGPTAAGVAMKRVAPGVFQGDVTDLRPELASVTSFDAQNQSIGTWPMKGPWDVDPLGRSISAP